MYSGVRDFRPMLTVVRPCMIPILGSYHGTCTMPVQAQNTWHMLFRLGDRDCILHIICLCPRAPHVVNLGNDQTHMYAMRSLWVYVPTAY
jgi:hypothetical protein